MINKVVLNEVPIKVMNYKVMHMKNQEGHSVRKIKFDFEVRSIIR